ncbi:MAG: hypothetical protein QXP91_06450 [Candidatus Methanomethylicia archaeon]
MYIVFALLITYILIFKHETTLDYTYVFLCIFTLVGVVTLALLKVLRIKNSLLVGFSGIRPVFLEIRPILLLVTGASSSGKTRFIQRIIKKLSNKSNIYVFDWYDEYNVLGLPRHEMNLSTVVFPIEKEGEIIETRDLLGTALNLTDQQMNLLLRVLKALSNRGVAEVSILDIKRMIERLAIDYENISETTMQQIILRKLESLIIGERRSIRFTDPGVFVVTGGETEKKIGYALILKQLLQKFSREKSLEEICGIIVIEEAHNLISTEDTIFTKWILEVQKCGAMIIMITPSASLISKAIKVRAPLWISFATAPNDTSVVNLKLKGGEAIIKEWGKITKIKPLFFKMEKRKIEIKERCYIITIINNKLKLIKNRVRQTCVDKESNYTIATNNNEIYSLNKDSNMIFKNICRTNGEWLIDYIDSNTVRISGPNIILYLPLTIESIAKLEEIKAPEKVIDKFLTILAEKNH